MAYQELENQADLCDTRLFCEFHSSCRDYGKRNGQLVCAFSAKPLVFSVERAVLVLVCLQSSQANQLFLAGLLPIRVCFTEHISGCSE